MNKIILASGSPRRKELLEKAGLSFDVMPSDKEEIIDKSDPAELVVSLSEQKCSDIAGKIAGADGAFLVIGADTVVVFEGKILGKPSDPDEAFAVLKMLSGNTHTVYTGVTLIDTGSGKKESFYEATDVTMYEVSDQEIIEYINTGEPMDKAGSYGIQGKGVFLVKGISGDYNNVVGLPVARLLKVLREDFAVKMSLKD